MTISELAKKSGINPKVFAEIIELAKKYQIDQVILLVQEPAVTTENVAILT